MKSLRQAILFRMAVLLLAVGIVSAVATYIYVRDEAQSTFDAQIRQFATYIDALDPSAISGRTPYSPSGVEDLFLVEVWNAAGKLTWSSAPGDTTTVPAAAGYSTSQIGGAHWRSFTVMNPERILRVSLPLDETNEQASTAALQIAIPMVLVIPLSWLVLSVMIDRIMGGLDGAARQIRSRRPNDARKVPEEGLPSEIKPFVTSINELVGRLNENMEQQKRFVSDAAHELRTPLTAIGIQIDNLERVLTTKPQRERLLPLKEGARRTNRLVERLLQLARAEKPENRVPDQPATLDGIFAALKSTFEPIASARRITLDFAPEASSASHGLADCEEVLGALIENAIAYSPEGSRVVIATRNEAIVVEDEGPGIPASRLPHVFDRFYRASDTLVPGTGLGLSIAKAVCERNGWTLRVENRSDRTGIIATISLK